MVNFMLKANSRYVHGSCWWGITIVEKISNISMNMSLRYWPLQRESIIRSKSWKVCQCSSICMTGINWQTCSHKLVGSWLKTLQRWSGTGSGSGSASGANCRKRFICNRDKLSVTAFREVDKCSALRTTFSCKHFNVMILTKTMTYSAFDVCEFKIWTTAWLSHLNRIFLLLRCWPQISRATKMGNNSSTVMSSVIPRWNHSAGHRPYVHFPWK